MPGQESKILPCRVSPHTQLAFTVAFDEDRVNLTSLSTHPDIVCQPWTKPHRSLISYGSTTSVFTEHVAWLSRLHLRLISDAASIIDCLLGLGPLLLYRIQKMTARSQTSLLATLKTSIALCQRFASSLAPNAPFEVPQSDSYAHSPLALLHAAVATLRAQVTKLSLLAITAPFTPTAITKCLSPVNESILTSLVTAALLTTPELFTPSFSAECRNMTATTIRDMQSLLGLVEARSRVSNPAAELRETEKKAFTEATSKIWDDCDKVIPLATEGVPGFVVRRSKQWLDLMKDAVKELEEWDPEDDVVVDDLLGISNSDDDESDDTGTRGTTSDRAAISAGVKEQALKVLNRIPQSIHVVIKQRLEKLPIDQSSAAAFNTKVDGILTRTRTISELIDESAEGLYLGDLELCLRKAGEARAITIEVVESVIEPLLPSSVRVTTAIEPKEDKYVQRALEWIRQADPGAYPGRPS